MATASSHNPARTLALAAALLACAATLLAPGRAAAVAYEPEPAFCGQTAVHDYLRPLAKLPQLRWPADSRLGFAPRIHLSAPTQLLVPNNGPPQIGYRLYVDPSATGTMRPRWSVTAFLARISWGGRVLKRIGKAQHEGVSLSPSRSSGRRWTVGGNPAAYRLVLVFRAPSGNRIATLGRYFRVVKPTENSRLALNASAFRPGQTIFAQLQNLGTKPLTYGYGYWIDKLTPSGWVEAPENPRMPVPAIALVLRGGQASKCESFDIPSSMPPGRYRILHGEASAEFDVLP